MMYRWNSNLLHPPTEPAYVFSTEFSILQGFLCLLLLNMVSDAVCQPQR